MKIFFNPNAAPKELYPMIPSLLIRGRDVAIWNPDYTEAAENYLNRDILMELLDLYGEERFSVCCSESYADRTAKINGLYAETIHHRINPTDVRSEEEYASVCDLSYACWRAFKGQKNTLKRLLKHMIKDMQQDDLGRQKIRSWEKEAKDRFGGSLTCAAFNGNIQDIHMLYKTKSNSSNVKPVRWNAYCESVKLMQLFFDGRDLKKPDDDMVLSSGEMDITNLQEKIEIFESWASEHRERINFIHAKHSEYISLRENIIGMSPKEFRKSVKQLESFTEEFKKVETFAEKSCLGRGARVDEKISQVSSEIIKRFERIRENDCGKVRAAFGTLSTAAISFLVYNAIQENSDNRQFVNEACTLFLGLLGVTSAISSFKAVPRNKMGDSWVKWRLSGEIEEPGVQEVAGIVLSHSDFWRNL